MKHNKEYRFSDDVKSVQNVVGYLISLGWEYKYFEFSMTDGTKHQFVELDGYRYIEIPDLTTALTWVVDDILMLKDLFENGYLVEDE